MRLTLRRQVRERYGRRCGYCGISELDNGAELTVDHFQPRIARIETLHLNRPQLVGHRLRLRQNERVARENLALREQIEAYEEDLRSLMERLRRTTS
jgi:FtsZ-binding cell division protein ZapB